MVFTPFALSIVYIIGSWFLKINIMDEFSSLVVLGFFPAIVCKSYVNKKPCTGDRVSFLPHSLNLSLFFYSLKAHHIRIKNIISGLHGAVFMCSTLKNTFNKNALLHCFFLFRFSSPVHMMPQLTLKPPVTTSRTSTGGWRAQTLTLPRWSASRRTPLAT